jgi:hypothetical protein
MPQRSNPFQRLIYLIQHQLAIGATVSESKFLPDTLSGRQVEVDVVIEGKLGAVPLVIGIECTAGKRPATVEWVDQMLGKHGTLPVDKTVLVSQSGFTSEARSKAQAHGIEALELSAAVDRDWSSWAVDVRNLRYATFTLTPDALKAESPAGDPERAKFLLVPESIIHEPGKGSNDLKAYVTGMLSQGHLMQQVFSEWLRRSVDERQRPLTFQIHWTCPSGTTVIGLSGDQIVLNRLTVSVRALAEEAPFAVAVSKFRGHNVVHGEVCSLQVDGGTADMVVSILEKDGKLTTGAGLLREHGTSAQRVIDFEFPSKGRSGDS